MESHYQSPSFTGATADNTYEVPKPPEAANSSDGKVVKYSCNWKLSVLFVCLGIFAVVASVSLVLAVWSVVRDRDSSLHTEVTPHVLDAQLAALQDLQNGQQSQLDAFQDQLNSFMANLSLYTVLQDSQTGQQNQLDGLQNQLNSFMANLSLYVVLQDSQTGQQNQLDDLQDQLNSFMANLSLFNQLTTSQREAIRRISVVGLTEDNPLSSCSTVSQYRGSGDYWIRRANGSSVQVYCDMTISCGNVTGGWTRVAYLKFENGSDPCPQGFRERNDSGIRTCGINSTTAACPSILFHTYGIPYSRVCGKVLGYQFSGTDAFSDFGRGTNLTIDSNYVDGVSLTHGSHPRQHIWTFAAAFDEEGSDRSRPVCSCSNPRFSNETLSPEFIRNNYFCDSGGSGRLRYFNGDDPLWDGAGCGGNSTCCSFNNPPWFQRELPSPTTDDIEMRVCSDEGSENEDTPLAHVEIYVQ